MPEHTATAGDEPPDLGPPVRLSPWHRHPGVRSGTQLTVGERAADRMRNYMGSWPFVAGFVVTMVAWAAINTAALGDDAFDPYPYILLNLFLSMLAGMQGAILLIAAKRADQVAAETALHTLQNTELVKSLIEQNNRMTERVEELLERLDAHIEGTEPSPPGAGG